jgi:hypothetical protein
MYRATNSGENILPIVAQRRQGWLFHVVTEHTRLHNDNSGRSVGNVEFWMEVPEMSLCGPVLCLAQPQAPLSSGRIQSWSQVQVRDIDHDVIGHIDHERCGPGKLQGQSGLMLARGLLNPAVAVDMIPVATKLSNTMSSKSPLFCHTHSIRPWITDVPAIGG